MPETEVPTTNNQTLASRHRRLMLVTVAIVVVAIVAVVIAATVGNRRGGVVAVPSSPSSPTTPTVPTTPPASPLPVTLFIADFNGFVEKVTPAGVLSIVGGNGQVATSPLPGPATQCPMKPLSVAVDAAGNLYIGEMGGYVEKVTPDGTLSVFAGGGKSPVAATATQNALGPVTGLAIDTAGNLFIADVAGYVKKVTPDGTLSIVAGTGDRHPTRPPGPSAHSAIQPNGIAINAQGDLFIADNFGYVEKLAPDGTLTILAGNGDIKSDPVPGPAIDSPMYPGSVAVDTAGNVYVTDFKGFVAKITPGGTLSVIAGSSGNWDAPTPGPATSSGMAPSGNAADGAGNLFIADQRGYIEMVSPDGMLTIVAGAGRKGIGPRPGPATNSPMNPNGVAISVGQV